MNKEKLKELMFQQSIISDREYIYKRMVRDGSQTEIFKGKIVLKKYMDGECYGTNYHYGYIFQVTEIIKKVFNHPVDQFWTLPDIIDDLEEVE